MGERQPASRLRLLGHVAGSALVWLSAMLAATRVLHTQPPSRMLRGAMVVLGTLGTLALVWTLGRLIRAEDEFSLRIHLAALGVAFGTLAVCLVSGDLLVRAGFVDDVSFGAIWMGMLVIWWLSIVITTRYYQ
jgi:hypothetical protein